jgi:hypothetical protein
VSRVQERASAVPSINIIKGHFMTTNPYSSIGPFKGVPADVLAQNALTANNAFEAALVALARHASAVGDEVDRNAVIRQSVAAANSVWPSVEAEAASRLRLAKDDYYTSFVPGAGFGALAVAACVAAYVAGHYEAARVAGTGALAAAFATVVMYFMVGKAGWAAIRQIRGQGYFDDTLPKALGRVAGSCLLAGTKALHVASKSGVKVRTVYWDSIGHALVSIDGHGLERVDIFGRDGYIVASITGPTGTDIDANGLVALVTERVGAARKAA